MGLIIIVPPLHPALGVRRHSEGNVLVREHITHPINIKSYCWCPGLSLWQTRRGTAEPHPLEQGGMLMASPCWLLQRAPQLPGPVSLFSGTSQTITGHVCPCGPPFVGSPCGQQGSSLFCTTKFPLIVWCSLFCSQMSLLNKPLHPVLLTPSHHLLLEEPNLQASQFTWPDPSRLQDKVRTSKVWRVC